MPDYDALMHAAIASCSNDSKWTGSKFSGVKTISNSHVGRVGQDFIEELCKVLHLDHQFPMIGDRRNPRSPWDIRILGKTFELKTATEDVKRCFQFNHIRHHRQYEGVICVGISPDAIWLGCYSKSDIATGRAGSLVTMDKGSSATFKLTKRKADLLPIDQFEHHLRQIVLSL